LEVVWVLLPVLGAFLAHAPVLRFDLLRSLKRPIDGGATVRGRRLLGDNKTWRGAVVMCGGVITLALVLSRWPSYWLRLPEDIRRAGAVPYAILLGLGTVLAELPNSFLKRQLDIAPGTQRSSLLGMVLSILDQGDFVFGVWIMLSPIWLMSPLQFVAAFAVVATVHVGVNKIGYAIGARTSAR